MAQPRTGGSPSPAEISSLRNATNLRTVSRNDPAVLEILDTSTYSVIYHYDEVAGKWAKQKQEGSLFVVRRSKAPEYALFMLNRVTVKNVTIPLIPGEMKATAIDASMLQVARRGQKIRYGIWFTEGTEGVQRFRDTIVKICGEPSKLGASSRSSPAPAMLPSTAISSNNNAPTPPAAAAAGAGEAAGAHGSSSDDTLSRLFAGLGTVPAKPTTPTSPPVHPPHPLHPPPPHHYPLQYHPGPQQYPVQSFPGQMPPPLPGMPPGMPPGMSPGMPMPYVQSPPFPQQQPYPMMVPSQRQSPPQEPAQQQAQSAPEYPPGQTVDDLLMSILGVPGGSPAQSGARAAPPPATQAPPAPPPVAPAAAPPMTFQQPPVAPGPMSSPGPKSPPGPVPTQAARQVSRQTGSQSSPSRQQNGAPAGSPSVHGVPPQPPAFAMRDALANALPPGPPLSRAQLRDGLMRLLSTDDRFVDDVWRAYLARAGAPAPQ